MPSISAIISDNVVPGLSDSLRLFRQHTAAVVSGTLAVLAPRPGVQHGPLLPVAGLDASASQALYLSLLHAAACTSTYAAPAVTPAAAVETKAVNDSSISQDTSTSSSSLNEGCGAGPSPSSPAPDLAAAPMQWLHALKAAQAASDRLLLDMHAVNAALRFWQGQLLRGSSGTHFWFLLLGRGPGAFLHALAAFLSRLIDAALLPLLPPPPAALLAPSPRQPPSPGTPAPPLLRSSSSVPGEVQPWQPASQLHSSTNQLQQRVLILKQLQRQMASALVRVHRAATRLWLTDASPASSIALLAPHLSTSYNTTAPQGPAPPGEGAGAASPPPAIACSLHLLHMAQQEAEACAVDLRQAIADLHAGTGWMQACSPLLAPHAHPPLLPSLAHPPGRPGASPSTWSAPSRTPLASSLIRAMAGLSDLLRPAGPVAGAGAGAGGIGGEGSGGAGVDPATFGLLGDEQGRVTDILLLGYRPGGEASVEGENKEGEHGVDGDGRVKRQGQAQTQHPASAPLGHSHAPLPGGSLSAPLAAARAAAAAAPPLVPLPPWLRMPSPLQRHWLSYTLRAAAVTWAVRFLYLHSRLSGSTDLERWAAQGVEAVVQAWRAHVAQPLANVQAELFHTFRDRPAIVSQEEFDADHQSLTRMLQDFAKDKGVTSSATRTSNLQSAVAGAPTQVPSAPTGRSSTAAGDAAAGPSAAAGATPALSPPSGSGGTARGAKEGSSVLAEAGAGSAVSEAGGAGLPDLAAGMQLVMLSYEAELRNPLRNLVMGDLARAMLIQVQRLKLDTEAAMLQLDQILRASELSISLMAAMPALLVAWGVLAAGVRLLTPRAPDVKRKAVPLRLAGAELGRAVQVLVRAQRLQAQQGQGQGQQGQQLLGQRGPAVVDPSLIPFADDSDGPEAGLVLFWLSRLHAETELLYRFYDRTSRLSEYPHLVADLQQLARRAAEPGAGAELAAMLEQVQRTYRAFQHPA